jgi:hypothetical protein
MPGRLTLLPATALGSVAAALALFVWGTGPDRAPQASGAPTARHQAAPPRQAKQLDAVAALPGFKAREPRTGPAPPRRPSRGSPPRNTLMPPSPPATTAASQPAKTGVVAAAPPVAPPPVPSVTRAPSARRTAPAAPAGQFDSSGGFDSSG